MTKRTKIIIVFALVLVVVGVAFLFLRSRSVSPPTPPPPTTGAGYKSLVPGVSTKDEVIARLGLPLNDTNGPILNYKSTNPNLPHAVSVEGNTAVFIKEQVTLEDKITKDGLIQLYGQPPEEVYGPNSVNGFNLFVYPDKGVAFLGHTTGSGVLEIWYFPPTTIESFLQTWGADYSEVHRPIQ